MEGAYFLIMCPQCLFIGTADTFFIDFRLLADTNSYFSTKLKKNRFCSSSRSAKWTAFAVWMLEKIYRTSVFFLLTLLRRKA